MNDFLVPGADIARPCCFVRPASGPHGEATLLAAGQEASRGPQPSVSPAEKAWVYSDVRLSASALSSISGVALSMLLGLSELCLIPHLSSGRDRTFP